VRRGSRVDSPAFPAGAIGCGEERIDFRGREVGGLCEEEVQPAPHGGDALLRVQPRRAPDGDDVHRMREEPIEVAVRRRPRLQRERRGLLAVRAMDGDDLDAVDALRRAHVRPGDAAGAYDSYTHPDGSVA